MIKDSSKQVSKTKTIKRLETSVIIKYEYRVKKE